MQLSLDIKPITAMDITRRLVFKWIHRSALVGAGVYAYHSWESDFIRVSAAGYAVEYEIKISRSDFRADFKKRRKHKSLQMGGCLKQFWYIAPKGIIPPDEIPEYSGLIEVDRIQERFGGRWEMSEVIKAPTLKNPQKLTFSQQQKILKSVYYKYYQKL